MTCSDVWCFCVLVLFCFLLFVLHTQRVIPASWRNWERSSEMKFWRSLKVFCAHISHTATYGISASFNDSFRIIWTPPPKTQHSTWSNNKTPLVACPAPRILCYSFFLCLFLTSQKQHNDLASSQSDERPEMFCQNDCVLLQEKVVRGMLLCQTNQCVGNYFQKNHCKAEMLSSVASISIPLVPI